MSSTVVSLNTVQIHADSQKPNESSSMYPALHDLLLAPHIDSFNALFHPEESILDAAVQNLEPREVVDAAGNRLRFWLEDVQVSKPMLSDKEHVSLNRFLLPREARERGVSYKGKMTGKLFWQVNNGPLREESRSFGALPIMVRSSKCHLNQLSAGKLVAKKEDPEELGGYFIVNGIERIIRLLIVARRNYPMALIRPSFAKRGPSYTNYGCQMRCVRPGDQTSQTIYLHYLNDGTLMVRLSFRKNEYLIPLILILKALVDTDDREIMEAIVQGDYENTFLTGRVEGMLRDFKRFAIYTRHQALEFIGSRFAVVMNMPKDTPAVQVGEHFLHRLIMVHLPKENRSKFDALVFMAKKCYGLVSGKCTVDNPDSPMMQEMLTSGLLYGQYLKEKFDDYMSAIQISLSSELRKNPACLFTGDAAVFKKVFTSRVSADIGKKMEYFLATGNLVSNTGLDLQQVTGFTVVAEKLNFFRYLAHFRSVHRGAFFAELKTTTVRKLLPEAWGFLCPVHTPDGAPCGLLNHLAHECRIPAFEVGVKDEKAFNGLLISLGVEPVERAGIVNPNDLNVFVDGRLIGTLKAERGDLLCQHLRFLKATSKEIPEFTEVAMIPHSQGGLYPGIFIFTGPSRMMRPVGYSGSADHDVGKVYIGTLEQVYLEVAIDKDSAVSTPLYEFTPTNMLSVVANTTPFCDFNQSPRNMYQCQMGKQTMGTPCHSYAHRSDNKLYRLYTPQNPIVKTRLHSRYGFDSYPNGTNAVVAVIAYTGYDMEDAMILNKGSYERGFAHACVLKSEFIECEDQVRKPSEEKRYFGAFNDRTRTIDGRDGLPQVGERIFPDDPLYSVIDPVQGTAKQERYKSFEEAYIDTVRVLGNDENADAPRRAHVTFRIPRNPIIGDKFSSRHGQKGVCSMRALSVDLPFTESGISPDIIINPHAFPSRMTIGMFVESVAGKAGALDGRAVDATPFQFGADDHGSKSAADHFGEELRKHGFNYYGNEPMWSGQSGTEMRVDIYIGVVYYQRLRHMVSDKFQVRTTGPVHNLTQQPVKGRKRAGGIRLGEMERDSLLAHGVAFILQDRLMNCSDYSQAYVCSRCESLLSCMNDPRTRATICQTCKSSSHVKLVAVPFVLRYLSAELMAMNVRMKIKLE